MAPRCEEFDDEGNLVRCRADADHIVCIDLRGDVVTWWVCAEHGEDAVRAGFTVVPAASDP